MSSVMMVMMMMTRWLSLNYNITALSVSSDSTRLLVCLAIMIQEIELLDSQDIRDRGGGETQDVQTDSSVPVTGPGSYRESLEGFPKTDKWQSSSW